MSKPTDQLIRILEAGANIIISSKPTNQLVQIVTAAARTGVHVTIKCKKPTEQLEQIARAAQGHATFDLTE